MTIQQLAQEAYDSLQRASRKDGSTYVRIADDAPDWVQPLVHDAHGDLMPDDWRYETIEDALSTIAESDNNLDEGDHEFADDADIYNADLLKWVGSHGSRGGYVDDALTEFGPARDFYHSLQLGQYTERLEVYTSVLSYLTERVEEEDLEE